jgi:hypothetical protein
MAAVMTGNAEHRIAQQGAGGLVVAVLLAEMGAVATELDRQVGPVVHQHGDAAGLRHGQQRLRRAAHRIVIRILQPDLQRGDVARIQRLRQPRREPRRLEGRWGDQVEAAAGLAQAAGPL